MTKIIHFGILSLILLATTTELTQATSTENAGETSELKALDSYFGSYAALRESFIATVNYCLDDDFANLNPVDCNYEHDFKDSILELPIALDEEGMYLNTNPNFLLKYRYEAKLKTIRLTFRNYGIMVNQFEYPNINTDQGFYCGFNEFEKQITQDFDKFNLAEMVENIESYKEKNQLIAIVVSGYAFGGIAARFVAGVFYRYFKYEVPVYVHTFGEPTIFIDGPLWKTFKSQSQNVRAHFQVVGENQNTESMLQCSNKVFFPFNRTTIFLKDESRVVGDSVFAFPATSFADFQKFFNFKPI